MFRPTLAFKFITLISLILILTFSCIGIFLFRHQQEILYSDLQTLALSLTRNLSANSVYGMVTRNITNLSNLLHSLSNYDDVAFAWIEDNSHKVLASYGTVPRTLGSGTVTAIRKMFPDNGYQHSSPEIVRVQEGQGIWIIKQPIMIPQLTSPDELILGSEGTQTPAEKGGELYVGISLERVKRTLRILQTSSLILLAAIAGLSLLLTLVLVQWISRPLKKLTQATEHVIAGILPTRVDINSRDEIGELATAFNNMIDQVGQSKKAIELAYSELERANQSLEETVEQRTAELRETISQLTKARDELESAYSEMKQMYHSKAAFLRAASHELRTPLTAIKANVDFLYSFYADSLGEEGRDIIRTVQKNINNMQAMVEDMLEMVRLDIGALPLEIEAFHLAPLARACINELQALQAEIHVEMGIPEWLVVNADKTKIHDMLINILNNAYRHTPDKGSVVISAALEGQDIVINISDTGEGIDEEHLNHLFEPFYQAHQGKGGTGLGLSIVKSIIDRHGGTIEVQSRPGIGTTFTIRLPGQPPVSPKQDIHAPNR